MNKLAHDTCVYIYFFNDVSVLSYISSYAFDRRESKQFYHVLVVSDRLLWFGRRGSWSVQFLRDILGGGVGDCCWARLWMEEAEWVA